MKIAITGANGLLGQKLIQRLQQEAEVETIATGRGTLRLEGDFRNLTYHEVDVRERDEVEALLVAERPDCVIHTAAMTNVDQCESEKAECRRLNVEATSHLAQACAHLGIHLVHLSTDFIFDGTAGPYDEEAQPNPLSYYGHSKWDAERVVMGTEGLKWAIARTILVYGLAQDMSRSNIVLWVRDSLRAGKKIKVVDDQYRTPTLAEDLADGCARIALQSATGIYNIGGPELLTPYQMALQTARYFNLDESLIERTDGSGFTQPAKRPARTGLTIDKARCDLGYNPSGFLEGIRRMVTSNGQLATHS